MYTGKTLFEKMPLDKRLFCTKNFLEGGMLSMQLHLFNN